MLLCLIIIPKTFPNVEFIWHQIIKSRINAMPVQLPLQLTSVKGISFIGE